MIIPEKNKTRPGMHPKFLLSQFNLEEQRILQKLSSEFFLTTGGNIKLLNSDYNYVLLKPTTIFSEMFNIEREVLCVFSSYENFEPRTLDAFHIAQRQLAELRVETVCRILISNDTEIEKKIENLLKTDPEQPIVIPFIYSELLNKFDSYFIRNRFRAHFYSRDLFSFHSPLKKDLYFFGRSELIQELINRHRSGEHTSLFGLRKSGKTSIIYAIERHLFSNNELYLSLDCESPSIHKLRWFELLRKIMLKFKETKKSKVKIIEQEEDRYNEKNAAESFQEDMLKIYNSKKKTITLFIFDEIERISPSTGASDHWRLEDDFIYFWQTMRGFYQRFPNVFTYLLVGTNPNSVEVPMIGHHENPLFASIPSQYVPNFSIGQVRQMVRKLGRFMGLKFDELIYSKLTDDYGGHPFLIRQVCSRIHKYCRNERPVVVDKKIYENVCKKTYQEHEEYLEMILQVLRDWYPDEYEMIKFLALEDYESFNLFSDSHSNYTKHLVGYGILQQSTDGYTFNVESIKDFLQKRTQYQRINLTNEEKIEEISNRRNKIEKNLRFLLKNSLKQSFGKLKACEKVLSSIPSSRRDKIEIKDIDLILHKDTSPLYFSDLTNLIKREWETFKNIFDIEKNKITLIMDDINTFGRPDAHSKSIKENDFNQLRLHFSKLEEIFEEWLE